MTTTAEQKKVQTPEGELVLVDDRGDYAVMTINRPEKRNAMSKAAQRRFREALREVYEKKVVVLTGTGPSFCAGVDLTEGSQVAASDKRVGSQEWPSWNQCNADLRVHPAIFIAAVNGFALGGGSTLINNCELAVAGESATIGAPEVGFGVWPGLAGPAMLQRVAPKHAAEIIFKATRIDAQTAYRMGMVNEVVADQDLLSRACELAEHIAGFDATVLDYSKKIYHHLQNLTWDAAMDYSLYASKALAAARGAAARDGVNAFAKGERSAGQGA